MTVYGYDPFISVTAAWGLSARVKRCDSIEQLLSTCDYASLHVPLTPDTEGLVNAEKLKRAKKGLRILNFSRGGLVERAAIRPALEDGTISRYVTDFPTPELLGLDGVLSIPHLGASTEEAEDNCAVMAVRELQEYLKYGNISNSVNFPNCSLETSGGVRLLVANNNVPKMLSQILEVLAVEGLNVEEMVNKHRDGVAYNIIDLSAGCISEKAMAKVSSIEGVIMTRQICQD